MNPTDFDVLSRLVKERSGLMLTPDKSYLLESRLLPVARKNDLKSVADLAGVIRGRPSAEMVREVVEAMTTNESFFFRDIKPFEQFRTVVLPALLKARAAKRQVRIWSAACSSGQEPYTLAMLLTEAQAQLAGWTVEILATDLSTDILSRAAAGIYSQFEVQRGLPIQFLLKYFKQEGERWQINPAIRSMVRYRCVNLLDDLTSLGNFDIIFCRNVLIYFDQPTKTRVLDRIARMLPSDGYLYLGGAETVLGITDKFQTIADNRGLYRPAIAPPQRALA